MNNLILFLTLLLACTSCANAYVYCYYCPNCPIPFDPNSPYVTRVTSNTNFCAVSRNFYKNSVKFNSKLL